MTEFHRKLPVNKNKNTRILIVPEVLEDLYEENFSNTLWEELPVYVRVEIENAACRIWDARRLNWDSELTLIACSLKVACIWVTVDDVRDFRRMNV